jgi:hypothetical protein
LLICVWCCLQVYPACACRYTVRETGFVDLGIEPYLLYCYVGHSAAEDTVSAFKEVLSSALVDTNLRGDIINTDEQRDHPAMKYLDEWQIESFPAAVLVSPDGQSLHVPITQPGRPFKETLSSAVDHILSSPKRKEILQQTAKSYGVVLLIEGPDAQVNSDANEIIAGTIESVSAQLEWMPKPINEPPVSVTLDSESLTQEKLLLWSLDLDVEDINQPHAAIFYGRGRWIGPMFKGEGITENDLASVLFVIGGDCECGLDRRWLQGTMLPARWDQELQALAAESLGFDPENPMIRSEMSWIMGRGLYAYPPSPIGYQELVIEAESPNDVLQIQPVQDHNADLAVPAAGNSVSAKPALGQAEPAFQKPLYLIAVLAILVVGVGLFVAIRAAKRSL